MRHGDAANLSLFRNERVAERGNQLDRRQLEDMAEQPVQPRSDEHQWCRRELDECHPAHRAYQ